MPYWFKPAWTNDLNFHYYLVRNGLMPSFLRRTSNSQEYAYRRWKRTGRMATFRRRFS